MSLTLIAAMTWPDRIIGAGNAIPWRLPEDLRRFKTLTLGHPVLMGRKTWESLPFKLPGRTNIVLSRGRGAPTQGEAEAREAANPDKAADLWARDLDHALREASQKPGGNEVFIIGGAQIYAQALPLADRLALTLIHHPFAGDARFPNFKLDARTKVSRRKHRHDGDPAFDYEFLDLERPHPQGAA